MTSQRSALVDLSRGGRSGEIAFSAHKQATQTSAGAAETIIFENILTNVGDFYSAEFGEFTAGIPGVYYFSVGLQVIAREIFTFTQVRAGVFTLRL